MSGNYALKVFLSWGREDFRRNSPVTENLIFSPGSFFEMTPLQAQRYVEHDVYKSGIDLCQWY